MELIAVKIFIVLGFFLGLCRLAYWADKKIEEYWKDDDDGS